MIMHFLSILIPCYNEERFIGQCIESILNCDYPKSKYEIIVIDGGSTDRSITIVEKFPDIILLRNPHKIVPISLNMGIVVAKGDYIIRLDAHCLYPDNYISKLVESSKSLDADNVGGICITKAKNEATISAAIVEVLGHPFGVGNSLFRTGASSVQEVDTVPFGCFKKDVFERFGYFDKRLKRNQDIELNKRIKNNGGKIYLIPDVYCTYYARDTLKEFVKNNFSNGLWNILTLYFTRKFSSLSLRHFVPLIFILSLLLPLLSSLIYRPSIYLAFVSLLTYLIFIAIISLRLQRKKKVSLVALITAFTALHISYGVGSFVGLLDVLQRAVGRE